jgi:TonB family protein
VNPNHPAILHEDNWDQSLYWMVLVSAGLHLVGVVLLIILPARFGLRPHPVTAYTVDLVSSDQLAGTNLVPGHKAKGKAEAPPKVVEPPKPAPKVEEVKKPPPEPKAEKKPEPPPPPKEKEEEKAIALAAATRPQPAEPTPTRLVQAKPEPKEKPKPETKPKPEKKPVAVAAAPTRRLHKPTGPPTPTKEELAERERDQLIAQAVKRRAQLAKVEQEGGGSGMGEGHGKAGGGPISVGPGQGAGTGVIRGVEFVLYYNKLIARLKEAWAWAGPQRHLEAVVSFRIAEDGQVSDVRITRPSGDSTYDASVLRAVRAVNPLAPPPEAYRKEFSEVEITFSPENLS